MFLLTESAFLQKLVTDVQPDDYFPDFILDFLKLNKKLRVITDKVFFSN
mgnify:CR=1 FL=1|jgi:hypothetical protein